MKIIYLIAGTYRPGGMERVLAGKVNWLCGHGVADVLVVTTDQCGRKPFFTFVPGVKSVDLDIGYEENNGGSFMNKALRYPLKQLKHYFRLKRLLMRERADFVVSMFCNDASFVPLIKDGSQKVLEIHFSRYKRLQYARRGLWAIADRWRYRNDKKVASRYSRFVVLTEEDRGYWEQDGTMPNIRVIPNARTFPPTENKVDRDGCHVVLAVGRYNVQKAFDRMIDVWSIVCRKYGDVVSEGNWILRIVGDGELREELRKRIGELDVSGSVVLGNAETDIRSVYDSAGIYAMTSLYEGLPMVLLEAQASGLPIVAMACKCGPKDVVTDGVDGFLVPEGDKDSMARKLAELMADSDLREKMGKNAVIASGRYDEDSVMEKWVNLFGKRL